MSANKNRPVIVVVEDRKDARAMFIPLWKKHSWMKDYVLIVPTTYREAERVISEQMKDGNELVIFMDTYLTDDGYCDPGDIKTGFDLANKIRDLSSECGIVPFIVSTSADAPECWVSEYHVDKKDIMFVDNDRPPCAEMVELRYKRDLAQEDVRVG